MNLKFVTICAAAILATAADCRARTPQPDSSFGDRPFEMPHVPRPAIPDRTVSIADFGGVGDGHALNTAAFADAIDALAALGAVVWMSPRASGSRGPSC